MPDSPASTIKLGLTEASVLDDLDLLLGVTEDKGQTEPPATDANEDGEGTQSESEGSEHSEDGQSPDDDAAETDDEIEPPKKYRIKGTDKEVTEDELVNGYLRQEDYTRKTQSLAESRKKFETEELPAVRKEREHYAEYLTKLRESIEQQTPKEPDWATLRQTLAPQDFTDRYIAWNEHQKSLNILKTRETEAKAKVAEDHRAQMTSLLAAENEKLLTAVPEWKDSTKRKAAMTELKTFAKDVLQYSEQEIDSIYDHRALLALRIAYKAHKAEKAKPEIRRALTEVKTMTPGPAGTTRRVASKRDKLSQRLVKTGSIRDAAALLETML